MMKSPQESPLAQAHRHINLYSGEHSLTAVSLNKAKWTLHLEQFSLTL
jgi:hypothetical protein